MNFKQLIFLNNALLPPFSDENKQAKEKEKKQEWSMSMVQRNEHNKK